MVQVASKFLVFGAMFATTYALSLPKRDITQVEADIASISTQVTSLDTAVNAFPDTGGSLTQALAINTASKNLTTTIASATTDVQAVPLPIAESDADTIFSAVQAFVPTIVDALTAIIAKKPSFDALIVADQLVSQDLASLNSTTSAFEAALVAAAPVGVTFATT
ncbi:hypothetical protein HWV62_13056 [Athelia sp. TMB]|nr:hypothetical protein HWV62_13056 [Athelia sp. TMB]